MQISWDFQVYRYWKYYCINHFSKSCSNSSFQNLKICWHWNESIIKLVKLIRALAEFHTKLEVINVLSELSVTPHTLQFTPGRVRKHWISLLLSTYKSKGITDIEKVMRGVRCVFPLPSRWRPSSGGPTPCPPPGPHLSPASCLLSPASCLLCHWLLAGEGH